MPDHDQFWVLREWGTSRWPDFIPLDSSDSDTTSDAPIPSPPLPSTSISRDFQDEGWAGLHDDDVEHEGTEITAADDGAEYGESGRSGMMHPWMDEPSVAVHPNSRFPVADALALAGSGMNCRFAIPSAGEGELLGRSAAAV